MNVTSQQKIVLGGCIGTGKINLIEFSSGKASERAEFSGSSDGEGYRGEWVSKSGDNKRFVFSCILRPFFKRMGGTPYNFVKV